jgi:homospermidine synthase
MRNEDKIKIPITQKIVFFGCGAVAKCCIHYFESFFEFNYDQITIVEKEKKNFTFPTVKTAVSKGAKVLHHTIRAKTLTHLFDNILKLQKYDLVIDLTTNTSTYRIFKECRLRGFLYINTSIEDEKGLKYNNKCAADNSILLQHINLQNIVDKTPDTDNVTTIIEFGMNPGLISVFVKQGLVNLARMVLKQKNDEVLQKHYRERNHKKIAEYLKVRAIHCSEIDTQVPKKLPKNKFVNTWSCVGLITEGVEPAEIQIGTHENVLPFKKNMVDELIPQLVVTKTPGAEIQFKSVVPLEVKKDGSIEFTHIIGRCIHHGEGISLNRYLGSFKYSPTMHYVYKLNPITDKQLNKTSNQRLIELSKNSSQWKVLDMYDNHLRGYDNVGALFILENNPFNDSKQPYCFWTGSILDDKYTRKVLKDEYFGPTIIQVMAGILSGVHWMLKNKNKGLVFGEDLDDNYIMRCAKKYLGVFYSGPTGGLTVDGTKLVDLIQKGGSKPGVYLDEL